MREIDGVLSEVKQSVRGSIRAIYRSSRFSARLLKKMMELRAKGRISQQSLTEYEEFLNRNHGRVRNASIPVREERADLIKQMFDKELALENATDRKEQARLKAELNAIKESIPELRELKKREIDFYLFPKVKGDTDRIQIAVAEKDLSKFYEWLQEHLVTNLSSDLSMAEFSVFTDNQYQFYKVPFEGAELEELVEEMKSFKLNPFLLKDLKEGDYEGWLAIPDADSGRTLSYLKAKGIRYQKGSKSEYLQSSERSEDEVLKEILDNEPEAGFVPENTEYLSGLENDESHNYAMCVTNDNCMRITFPEDYVKEGFAFDAMQEEYGPNGFFAVRRPETYGPESEVLLFDRSRVFRSDDGANYEVFVYKNEGIPVVKPEGHAEHASCSYLAAVEVAEQYQKALDSAEQVNALANEAIEKTMAKAAEAEIANAVLEEAAGQIML